MRPAAKPRRVKHLSNERRRMRPECAPDTLARMLPETDVARVKRWAQARNDELPERAVGLIRFEIDVGDRALTIRECRPPWRDDDPDRPWTRRGVARLRYTQKRREWTLYWCDRNLKFRLYDLVDPTPNVEALLAEVDADPTCIFWG